MEFIKRIKIPTLWLAFLAYIYLWSCRLWFENAYVTSILQIPYIFLLVVDIWVLWERRKELFKMIGFYFSRNKILFIGIFLFVICDIITLAYAMTLSYSITKYVMFIRTMFLVGSIYLCCYDDDSQKMKENIESCVKCICWILIIFVISTIIRWGLGLSPYLQRVSLRADYNVYALYFMFALVFYAFYYIKSENYFSKWLKVIYIIFGIVSCTLIYLSASRRAMILCPVIVIYFLCFYAIRKIIIMRNSGIKLPTLKNIKFCIIFLCFFIILIGNFRYSVPLFEKYISTVSEEKKLRHKNFMADVLSGGVSGESTVAVSETSISDRYDSVKTEEGLSSRRNIWKVAILEISEFNLKEKLIGKGNGYSWNLYENEDNEAVRELLDLYEMDEPTPQWMMPHNFFLTEFLEGGLFKIVVIFLLAIAILYSLLQYMRQDIVYGMMLLLLYFCHISNFMLGTTYGLIGEDLFWLTTGFLILFRSCINFDNKLWLKKE